MGKVKKLIILVAIALGVVGSSGCTRVTQNESPLPAIKQPLTIAVYYVKTVGQEEYLVREVHRIPYTPNTPEAAAKEVVSGKPVTEGAERIFPPGTKILGVTVENGTAIVNFSREVLQASVGSEGEALGIQSMVNTLTEFPQIRAVSFQVEGKLDSRARDWWGHVGLYDQPFKRDLSRVFEPVIWVTHPVENQVASIPLLVKGSARVFEATVNVRLKDSKGRVLAEGVATATDAAPGRGDFELRLRFDPPSTGAGELEVFWINPEDGRESDKVIVPVRWP